MCSTVFLCRSVFSTDAKISNAVVSNCFNHHIYHLHVHRFRYDRTTNVLSLLIFNACNRAAWCKLVDQSDVG